MGGLAGWSCAQHAKGNVWNTTIHGCFYGYSTDDTSNGISDLTCKIHIHGVWKKKTETQHTHKQSWWIDAEGQSEPKSRRLLASLLPYCFISYSSTINFASLISVYKWRYCLSGTLHLYGMSQIWHEKKTQGARVLLFFWDIHRHQPLRHGNPQRP